MTPAPADRTAPAGPDELEYVSLPATVLFRGDRRLEAETYLTGGYSLRLRVESAFATRPLNELADIWQPSRLKGTTVAREHGLPFFTATQAYDIRPIARKWVAPSKTPDLDRRFVEQGWILLTCSGSVGDTIVAFEPHLDVVISHDLLRMQVRDEEQAGYLYFFLRSRYGKSMMQSNKYGSIVKHLEPEHLFDLPVPRVLGELTSRLNEAVRKIFKLRGNAYKLTLEAEQLYSEQFPSISPAADGELGFTSQAASMFSEQRRLDAYHYNPHVQAVREAIKTIPHVPLSEVTESVFGVPRFKHIYQDKGTPYLDSEDLFKLNPEITKYIPPGTKKNADKYYVKAGWLLMACSGQLYGFNGTVVTANEWHENKIVSNHVLRIIPANIRQGYLNMVLGHPVLGRPIVLSMAFGSEVPEISPEALSEIPVPRFGPIEEQIADRVEGAGEMRGEADREEDAAVQQLEAYLDRHMEKSDT